MNNNHPITPSPELVERLFESGTRMEDMLELAFQAGADAELEACDDYVSEHTNWPTGFLTSARRPKPLSLKEEALASLADIEQQFGWHPDNTVRRALEALPEPPTAE